MGKPNNYASNKEEEEEEGEEEGEGQGGEEVTSSLKLIYKLIQILNTYRKRMTEDRTPW
jgi:flagellar biosynthesis/type III secretory pathway protein FliH